MTDMTKAQAERVDMAIEEASEVIKELCKASRFGFDSYHPNDPSETNADRVTAEFADMIAVLELMVEANDPVKMPSREQIEAAKDRKVSWSKHQPIRPAKAHTAAQEAMERAWDSDEAKEIIYSTGNNRGLL